MDQQPTLRLRYELVNVNELPSVNLTRSIKSVVFTKRGLQRFNWLMSKLNRPMAILYNVFFATDIAMLVVPPSIGKWFAVVKVVGQMPMLLQGVASLRIDMLKCLLWMYEFWFFSTMNLANCVAIGIYFGDLRAITVVSYWLAIQMNICVDANMQKHQFAGTSWLAILYQFGLLVTVSLQLTPQTHTMTLLTYKAHSMTSNDVLVNAIGTTAILMVRTAYRKRQHLNRKNSTSVVRCVSYRCRVKLQEKQGVSDTRTSSSTMSRNKIKSRELGSVTGAAMAVEQLRLASQGASVFNEDDVVWPTAVQFLRDSTDRTRRRKLLVLYSSGVLGLALNLVPFIWKHFSFTHAQFTALWVFGLSCPTCYFAAFVCFFNRRLLRELVFSFDFCFLSAHLTIVHLCVCDLFVWDTRCFTVFFNWLAVHWVLTLDALTPSTRRCLGLRICFVTSVVGFVILSICRVPLDQIAFTPSRPTHDRVLWKVQLLKSTHEFRMVPFILNRAWTVLLWCFSLLWRVGTSGEDDRIIIQANVEFAASNSALDRRDDRSLTLRNLLISRRGSGLQVQPHWS